ncbi:MAG: hypothetical protein ACJ8C8_02945 [Microvirga sp.]
MPWSFFGTVTIDVIANDGSPFDGVLTLYAGKSSTVVATGTSLGSGETFLQFNGASTYSSYTLELQDNGNDQTGGYTIFVNVPNGRGTDGARYTPTTGNDTVTGNGGRDLLVGGGGNDTLIGREGHDVLIGGPGADTLQGGVTDPRSALSPDDNDLYVYVDATDTVIEQPNSGIDTIWTREVSFTLPANVENLLLVEGTAARDGIGNALNNLITGNSAHNGLVGNDGNDTLIGGGGADDMFGGFGNDTYYVDNASDLVGEPFGGGFDTVRSSLPAYVLADGLEALILDPGATWAIGNAGDNTLTGNGISNYLIGYGGNDSLTGVGGDASNDTMIGGLGDDTYHLDSAGDQAIENPGEGSDIIVSEAPSYTLPSNVEAMFLGGAGVWGFGNESDNTLAGGTRGNFLFGRGGNDYLNGGGGADYLEGGAGADVFLFTRGEANGDAVADFTPGQDRLGFIGYGLGSTFTQVDATHWMVNSADGTTHETINLLNAPTITPADFFFPHDRLVGGDGDDTLIGSGGADDMFGGLGNDTYYVDNANDLVSEAFGAGFDTVRSSLPSYALADNFEALVLEPGATWAVGNAGDNTLVGNAISNYLVGLGGNDSLTGVGGDTSNDTMIGGLGDDTYHLDSAGDGVIENAGEGSDLIISEAPSYTLPSNVEAMFLVGAGVWGFGNESDNTLAGSSLGNNLFGRGGNDYLNGGGGTDYLEGGAGADVFLFARGEAHGDTVADFTPGQDRLGFMGYGLGGTFTQIDATHWAVNSADGTTHETITLSNAPSITPADFFFT